jgi:TonB family protein
VALIAPDPAPGRANAASPRPDDQKDRGGTERTIPEDQDASPTLAESPTPEEGEDTETVKVVEKVESIADLRADLGWGGFERTQDQPRRIVPGTRQSEGSMPTSPQSAAEALTVSLVASTDAVDSPLGRYRAALDREISKLWLTMDLSVHERALGIQGDVFVRFLVESDGKVSGKVLTRSSGYASLDSMALDAIPERLPRIPRDVDYQRIYHEYRFHYRNPTIVGGSGGSP